MSPSDVIRGYPHIRRIMTERDQLGMRLDELATYYDECAGIMDDKQRDLLCKQITALRAYVDILQQRINYDIQYYSK